jgi:hypothetical protein
MDTSFLQGAGLFMCVAGIVLVVLLALAVRAFTSAANRKQTNRDVFDERGRERPTYDSERVESRGGFGSEGGSIPQTGRTSDFDRDRNRVRAYDSDRQPGDPLPRLDDDDQDISRRRERRDDDDVRSSGGFGT